MNILEVIFKGREEIFLRPKWSQGSHKSMMPPIPPSPLSQVPGLPGPPTCHSSKSYSRIWRIYLSFFIAPSCRQRFFWVWSTLLEKHRSIICKCVRIWFQYIEIQRRGWEDELVRRRWSYGSSPLSLDRARLESCRLPFEVIGLSMWMSAPKLDKKEVSERLVAPRPQWDWEKYSPTIVV